MFCRLVKYCYKGREGDVSVPYQINTLYWRFSDFSHFSTMINIEISSDNLFVDRARDLNVLFFVSWARIILLTLLPHSPVFKAFRIFSS